MNTKRPAVITIAVISLVLLVLVSSGWALAGNFGLLGFNTRLSGVSQMQGDGIMTQEHISSQVPANISPGAGIGFFNQGNRGSGQRVPGMRIIQGITGTSGNPSGLIGIFRSVTIGLNMILLVLGLIIAFGLWSQKKWAAILAIILSAILLLVNLPGMTRILTPLLFGINLLKVLLALAVIILLLLPAARKAYAPGKDLDLLEGLE
ncbi:hypothetical protein ACFLXB_06280 [Chloroflexota bacterium]